MRRDSTKGEQDEKDNSGAGDRLRDLQRLAAVFRRTGSRGCLLLHRRLTRLHLAMRLIVAIGLAVLLFLGLFVVGEYRSEQATLRQHLEQRDARHRQLQQWLDEVERNRERQ